MKPGMLPDWFLNGEGWRMLLLLAGALGVAVIASVYAIGIQSGWW